MKTNWTRQSGWKWIMKRVLTCWKWNLENNLKIKLNRGRNIRYIYEKHGFIGWFGWKRKKSGWITGSNMKGRLRFVADNFILIRVSIRESEFEEWIRKLYLIFFDYEIYRLYLIFFFFFNLLRKLKYKCWNNSFDKHFYRNFDY